MGLETTFGVSLMPVFIQTAQPGRALVSICNEYTGNGFGHRLGRNSEFCVAVGSATRIAGIVTLVG